MKRLSRIGVDHRQECVRGHGVNAQEQVWCAGRLRATSAGVVRQAAGCLIDGSVRTPPLAANWTVANTVV